MYGAVHWHALPQLVTSTNQIPQWFWYTFILKHLRVTYQSFTFTTVYPYPSPISPLLPCFFPKGKKWGCNKEHNICPDEHNPMTVMKIIPLQRNKQQMVPSAQTTLKFYLLFPRGLVPVPQLKFDSFSGRQKLTKIRGLDSWKIWSE